MNELIKISQNLETCEPKNISKQVMSVCRAITPQFYKNMSLEDMRAEKLGIELLVSDIDQTTLAEMCKRAVLNYPLRRSQNNKAYFDINYILEFYEESFNFVHSESIQLSKNAKQLRKNFDPAKRIIYQTWDNDGVIITTANIVKQSQYTNNSLHCGEIYSLKDFERFFTDTE